MGGGFVTIDATHSKLLGSRSVAIEAKDPDPVHRQPEGPDVGPLEKGRVAAPDCTAV